MNNEMYLIERIRNRAYHLWEAEGYQDGLDIEYWYRAELEEYLDTCIKKYGESTNTE